MVTHSRTPLRVDRLRALNVPQRVVVVLDDEEEPREVREVEEVTPSTSPTSKTSRTSPTSRRVAAVAAVGEIWRVDDEWWRAPITRRYIEVMLEGGRHVMLFEDLTTHEWFLQDI